MKTLRYLVDVIFVITLEVNLRVEEEERESDAFNSDSPLDHGAGLRLLPM